MSVGFLSLIFFATIFIVLAIGIPISYAIGGVSIFLILLFWGPNALGMVVLGTYSKTSGFEFLAIPLFIFMANMLERSGIAEDLYDTIHKWFGGLRGGLAVGTVAICTLFAAMAGVSGAATVAMGIIALPAMLNRGYSKFLALGCISAGGALGVLIPPSITMIIYGLMANVSIGKLYAGGILPGLLLASLFIIYIFIRSALQPDLAPSIPVEDRCGLKEKLTSLKGLILPIILVFLVLGSILLGITSVSEAAAVGAFGSMICAAVRRKLSLLVIKEACDKTLLVSCLIFWIIIGAAAFSTLYTAMGASAFMKDLALSLPVNKWVILWVMQFILIALGMIMETAGIIMITVPVFAPVVVALGFDPVWFGVLFIVNMELGFLTPPFGYNLFYLKGVAPDNITMIDLYRSIVPFVLLQFLGLIICMLMPQIILYIPNLLF